MKTSIKKRKSDSVVSSSGGVGQGGTASCAPVSGFEGDLSLLNGAAPIELAGSSKIDASGDVNDSTLLSTVVQY